MFYHFLKNTAIVKSFFRLKESLTVVYFVFNRPKKVVLKKSLNTIAESPEEKEISGYEMDMIYVKKHLTMLVKEQCDALVPLKFGGNNMMLFLN